MGDESGRRVFNRLTSVKLALQMLERMTELSAFQRRLVETAIEAIDALVVELLTGVQGRRTWERSPARRRETSALGRIWTGLTARRLPIRPRFLLRPVAGAAAALVAGALFVFIVVGAALLVQVLLVLGLVAAVGWLIRR
jgi:hypothetical protein